MGKSTTRQEIIEKVKHVVATQLQVDKDKIGGESLFVDDLGADSLDLTELAIAFEDAFELEIPEADFGKLVTVTAAADYISERLK